MIKEVENGVHFYRSSLLTSPHAFSTRLGGVSKAPHLRSMNLGHGRGDDEAILRENYRLFLAAANLPTNVVSANQIHTNVVHNVTKVPDTKPDCLPILMEDPEAGIVAAVHAGWRGSAQKIVCRALDEMEKLGAKRERIRAVIGPRIGVCCFEVKDDFVAEYRALLGDYGEKFLVFKDDRIFCDLPALNRALLLDMGVKEEHFEDSGLCTCCAPETFFSHRASKGLRGTMAAMISVK